MNGLRRSLPQLLLSSVIGLGLVLVLHACQFSNNMGTVYIDTGTESTALRSPTLSTPSTPSTAIASAPTSSAPNPPRGDVRLVVISDLNDVYGSTDYSPEVDKAIALIPGWNPDLVICGGDMIAGQKTTLPASRFPEMWSAFDDHIAAPLRRARIPYGFTVGNHDASSARGANGGFAFERERAATAQFWQDPAHSPGVQFIDSVEYPFYYTFEQNGIFFLVWDGSSSRIPADKLAWVERSLASARSQSAQMRVLVGHLPLYAVSVGRNQPGEVMDNADQLRSLLERYHVHTYISGHAHAYYPAHRGNLQLLHSGLLGSGLRSLLDSSLPPGKTITLVDINFSSPELTTYTTYDIGTLQPIPLERLPRFLAGHNGIVMRRDVEWNALTASEKAVCVNRLGTQRCSA